MPEVIHDCVLALNLARGYEKSMSSVRDTDLLPARISEVVQRSPRVLGLRIQGPTDFTWAAGQHVALSSAPRDAPLGYYSIASAPDLSDPGAFDLAAAIDALPEGVLAQIGSRVWVSDASGIAVAERIENAREVVLVGMGTGVAPLRAILQVLLRRPTPGIIQLIQGARTLEDLLFYDEFSVFDRSGFSYSPVLSRPDANWAGLRGHVQDHLDHLSPDTQYCVCGSLEMVKQVQELLIARGAPGSQVYAEGY